MNSHRKIAGVACFTALALCSGCWFGSDDDHSKKVQSVPMDLKAETQTASELVGWIKARKDQTEIQKKESFDKLKGKMVAFRGEVREVGKTAFGGKPFVYVSAFGLFTEASYQTPRSLKNSFGKLAYLLEGAKSLARVNSYHIRFRWEEREIEDDFIYGMMTNSRTVGGFELPINDDARLDDGLMEVTLIRTPKTAADHQSLINILITQQADEEHVYHFQTDRISFSCDAPLAWTVDGEYGGDVREGAVEILHGALTMLI